jgi:hypothetical protein
MVGAPHSGDGSLTAPATFEAKQWNGWGTALKPASEHWLLVRKPISEDTVAANVLKWGCGGINIDGSRIGTSADKTQRKTDDCANQDSHGFMTGICRNKNAYDEINSKGRFPANLILSHNADCVKVGSKNVKSHNPDNKINSSTTSNAYGEYLQRSLKGHASEDGTETVEAWECSEGCAVAELDRQSGSVGAQAPVKRKDTPDNTNSNNYKTHKLVGDDGASFRADTGGASRFFYCAKASRSERNHGVQGLLTWENADQNLEEKIAELNQLARDISDVGTLILSDTEWNTLWSGSNTSEKSQMDIKYTTSIILKLITELKTSNALPHCNTKESILDAIKMIKASGSNLAVAVEFFKRSQQIITNPQTVTKVSVNLALSSALLEIRNYAKLGNIHSTVKPIKLMQYLITMITPPNGTVLDTFNGSGTTGLAALTLGMKYIGMEKQTEYADISLARWKAFTEKPKQ